MTNQEPESYKQIDFANTQNAFAHKSNKELKQTALLFRLMNNKFLSGIGTTMMLIAVKLKFPFVKSIIRKTIYKQFCGGISLLDCQEAIDHLQQNGAMTILDYGAESKSSPEELNEVLEETIRAVELAAANNSVPVVSTKITGLVDNEILIKVNKGEKLDTKSQSELDTLNSRLDRLFSRASELSVGIFVDAEESWMQDAIDGLVMMYMAKYNKEKAIVFNTYQLYRHDKLAQLKADHKLAISNKFILGAKLVRGAYMDKERRLASEQNYPSPINKDKAATDFAFNESLKYCLENYLSIASCCASHNAESNLLQAKLMYDMEISKDHPHVNFCQLYGMSDNISFNLASHGYNIAKYVPYGPVEEVIPYLTRRAKENTSITGEASRELGLIKQEVKRRGI